MLLIYVLLIWMAAFETAGPVIPGGGRGSLVQGPPSLTYRPPQAAGPEARVRVEVCDWPVWSTQVIEIESPGWYLTSA